MKKPTKKQKKSLTRREFDLKRDEATVALSTFIQAMYAMEVAVAVSLIIAGLYWAITLQRTDIIYSFAIFLFMVLILILIASFFGERYYKNKLRQVYGEISDKEYNKG